MKLSWKQVQVLGFTFTLPLIVVIVQQLDPAQVELFRQYRAEMAECPLCHKFYGGHYHLSLIAHLVDDHKADSMSAMTLVDDLGLKKLSLIRERRAEQTATN